MLDLTSKLVDLEIVKEFKDIVRRFPNNVAIKDPSGAYTYSMLDSISDKVATNIIKYFKGQGGKKIALLHEANNKLVIAILAILKSGNTYIPVEKTTPTERIKYILSTSDVDLCICDNNKDILWNDIVKNYPFKTMDYFVNNKLSALQALVSTTEIAYIIYTSGTTGVPKGVEVTHKNVAKLVKNTTGIFNFTSKDRWLLFHSYSFDFSVWEIFGTLLTGGTLYIPQRETTKNLELMAALINNEQITILNQTPNSFYILQEVFDRLDVKLSIRAIIFGGEKLNFSKLITWHKKHPLCQLVNMYGITEATVHSTFYCIKESDFEKTESIIGVPIPGWKISLRDSSGEKVSQGKKGEIWISGDGLTNGYANNFELTSQRYIKSEGDRWYKTGDLAYEKIDGNLCYIGRIDKQVKIRGYRIELSEIDEILYNFNGIRSYTTVIKENDGQKIITFIKSEIFDENFIRAIVKKYLPNYMMPTYFFFISEFPINMNGKINIDKLLTDFIKYSESIEKVGNSEEYADTSVYIQSVFRKHLKKNVNFDENFFEIGGDSMMAMRITKEINEHFTNINLSIIEFYKNSTINKLNRIVREKNVVNK